MPEPLVRFLVGGALVSLFAFLGGLFKPLRFAGLFSAAPSVALASLALTIAKDGTPAAATEARSMLAGALALLLYAMLVCRLLMRRRWGALPATLASLPVWFLSAFFLWAAFLR